MVDKLVGKLIRGKIVEITIVLVMVIVSIPVWNTFGKKISNANVIDIDQFNLAFAILDNGNSDTLTVTNDYRLNKSFRIVLRVNIDNSSIIVNDKSYKLADFEQYKKGAYYYFNIVTDYVVAETLKYDVTPNLDGNIINYAYIFEENINF